MDWIWHVFFDTEAIYTTSEKQLLLNVPQSHAAHVHLYVPHLVVEERAHQLAVEYEGVCKESQRFAEIIKFEITARDELLHYFKSKIVSQLEAGNVKVFDAEAIGAAEQTALFRHRIKSDYKDTVITAAVAKYAVMQRLRHCALITSDNGPFQEIADVLTTGSETRITVLAKRDYEIVSRIDPAELENLTELFKPLLKEKLNQKRGELVLELLKAGSSIYVRSEDLKEVVRRRYQQPMPDWDSIRASIVRSHALCYAAKDGREIPVNVMGSIEYLIEDLSLGWYFDISAEGAVDCAERRFSNPQLKSITVNWRPTG